MATLTKSRLSTKLQNLPTVEYPDEVVQRWLGEIQVAKAQLATGELVPRTVEEIAAEYGITLNGEVEED